MNDKKNRKHPAKGDYGYYVWEKKKRAGIVCLLYGICLLIFITGIIINHTRSNILTVVAILGVLPAAKWTVSLIMVLMQRNISPEVYETTEKIAGDLVHGYELCVTAYEGRLSLDAVVVCGNCIAAYSDVSGSKKTHVKDSKSGQKIDRTGFMETHIRKIIHGNGFGNPTVKIFTRFDQYVERIKQLSADPDKYREGLRYTPDEQHAGETRDEALLRIIKNISI